MPVTSGVSLQLVEQVNKEHAGSVLVVQLGLTIRMLWTVVQAPDLARILEWACHSFSRTFQTQGLESKSPALQMIFPP